MKVVVPMAGWGSRFRQHGINIPKPLVNVKGRPMLTWALESLDGIPYTDLIFVLLAEHEHQFGVSLMVNQWIDKNTRFVFLDKVTEGQLCTVLAARDLIDGDEGVLIASSDTYVHSNLGQDIKRQSKETRGIISVADMPGDRWSFARTDESGWVVDVAEKNRISDHASTGLYYFSSGKEFLSVADEMIRNQEKVRGEYYVIPVYQKYIQRGWRVAISPAEEMWDMGTPAALAQFEQHLEIKKAPEKINGY